MSSIIYEYVECELILRWLINEIDTKVLFKPDTSGAYKGFFFFTKDNLAFDLCTLSYKFKIQVVNGLRPSWAVVKSVDLLFGLDFVCNVLIQQNIVNCLLLFSYNIFYQENIIPLINSRLWIFCMKTIPMKIARSPAESILLPNNDGSSFVTDYFPWYSSRFAYVAPLWLIQYSWSGRLLSHNWWEIPADRLTICMIASLTLLYLLMDRRKAS